MLNWKDITERLFCIYAVSTQEQLGQKLGLSQDMISKWVNGKTRPTWDVITKVIEEKSIGWDWLLTGEKKDTSSANPDPSSDIPYDNLVTLKHELEKSLAAVNKILDARDK